MLHPSYSDLMNIANSEVEQGEQPVVNSRYSIVLATAKRARQIIPGSVPLAKNPSCPKPLSIAIEETYEKKCDVQKYYLYFGYCRMYVFVCDAVLF